MKDTNQVFFGQSIASWIDMIHTHLSKQYQMSKLHITPGKFGYESYIYVVHDILSNVSSQDILRSMRGDIDMDKFVEIVHTAWIKNYVLWKNDHSKDQSVISVARDNKATTQAKNLTSNEQGMYRDLVAIIFDILSSRILELGMQQLTV